MSNDTDYRWRTVLTVAGCAMLSAMAWQIYRGNYGAALFSGAMAVWCSFRIIVRRKNKTSPQDKVTKHI